MKPEINYVEIGGKKICAFHINGSDTLYLNVLVNYATQSSRVFTEKVCFNFISQITGINFKHVAYLNLQE